MANQLQELVGQEVHYNNQRGKIISATLDGEHVCCHIQNGNNELQNLDLLCLIELKRIKFVDPAITRDYIHELRQNANTTEVDSYAESQDERAQILDYLKNQRKVEHLLHFTYLYNLRNILEHGILPVDTLISRQIKYYNFDCARFDHRQDCSSFSISFPNYRVLYIAKQQPVYLVILKLPIDCLSELPIEHVAFLPTNAATRGLDLQNNFAKYTGVEAVKNLFCENVENGANHRTRKKLGLPLSYTSNPQAEVFIQGEIPPKYIEKVYVPGNDRDAFNEAKKIIGDSCLRVGIAENEDYFKPRMDYHFWR